MDKNDFFKNKDNVIAIIGIIFFVVLAIFARFSTNDNVVNDNKDNEVVENKNEETTEDTPEKIVSYNFTYTVDNNNQISIIEGKVYNNIHNITYMYIIIWICLSFNINVEVMISNIKGRGSYGTIY